MDGGIRFSSRCKISLLYTREISRLGRETSHIKIAAEGGRGFQRLRHALGVCVLLYQPKKEFLRLLLDVPQDGCATFRPSAGLSYSTPAVLLQISSPPLIVNTDGASPVFFLTEKQSFPCCFTFCFFLRSFPFLRLKHGHLCRFLLDPAPTPSDCPPFSSRSQSKPSHLTPAGVRQG